MRSLCIARAPTASLSVAPPGAVPSLTGFTALAVPDLLRQRRPRRHQRGGERQCDEFPGHDTTHY